MVEKKEAKLYIHTNILHDCTQLLRHNFVYESFCKYILQYNKVMRSYSFWVVLVGLSSGPVESLKVKERENHFTVWIPWPHSPALSLAKAEGKLSCCTACLHPSAEKGVVLRGKTTSYFSIENLVITLLLPPDSLNVFLEDKVPVSYILFFEVLFVETGIGKINSDLRTVSHLF